MLTTAIIGLVGVVVGGLISGGVTYFFDWRRAKKTTRAASRLVYAEVLLNASALRVVAYHKDWGHLQDYLVDDMWKANRELLAAELDNEEWGPLFQAYEWIGMLISEGKEKSRDDKVDVVGVSFTGARSGFREAGPRLMARAEVTGGHFDWTDDDLTAEGVPRTQAAPDGQH